MIDASTFAARFDELYPRLYAYIRAKVRTQEIAEDLTAATFERALRHQHSFNPTRGDFDAWLFQIGRNVVIDHYKRQERQPAQDSLDAASHVPAAHPSPEQQVVQQEQQQLIQQLLTELSERDQEIIRLRFFGRLTNRKIAELLAMNEKTVSVVIYRALNKLKTGLAAREAV